MKKCLLSVSIASILLGSSPAIAMQPQVEVNRVEKTQVLRQIFAQSTQSMTKENAEQSIDQTIAQLKENNITLNELVGFISSDMTASQKARLEDSIEAFRGEDISKLPQEELSVLMGELHASIDTGSHYRSCNYKTEMLYGTVALGAGLVALLALADGNSRMTNAEDAIDEREKLIIENESLIEILKNEGVNENSFFILDIQAENRLYQKEIEEREEDYNDAKTTMTVGWGALAVSATSGYLAWMCN